MGTRIGWDQGGHLDTGRIQLFQADCLKSLERGMSQYSGSACKGKHIFTFGWVECKKFRGDMRRDQVEVSLEEGEIRGR